MVARYNLLAVPVVDDEGQPRGHRHRRRRARRASCPSSGWKTASADGCPGERAGEPRAGRRRADRAATPPALGRRARFAADAGASSARASSAALPTTTPAASRPIRSPGAKFGYDLLWVILVTQLALFVTQEIGARMGLATGQGLTGLIRERFGVRWAAFAALTMIVANLGSTVSEFAGISAALSLFGVPDAGQRRRRGGCRDHAHQLRAASAASSTSSWASGMLVSRRVHHLGRPGPAGLVAAAIHSLIVPHGTFNGAYMLAVVGTVGTTITPWGQGFIQAYVVDKRLRPEDLARGAARRAHRRAHHQRHRRVHRHRLRGDAVDDGQRDITECRARPRGPCGRSPGRSRRRCSPSVSWRRRCWAWAWFRWRAPTPRARRSAGSRASTGAGARRRRSTACWPSSSASPRCSCSFPGLPLIQVMFSAQVRQRPAAAGHPGLRDAARRRPRLMGHLVSGRINLRARLARDGHARGDVGRARGDRLQRLKAGVGGRGRIRTGTPLSRRQFLKLLRLPVTPLAPAGLGYRRLCWERCRRFHRHGRRGHRRSGEARRELRLLAGPAW